MLEVLVWAAIIGIGIYLWDKLAESQYRFHRRIERRTQLHKKHTRWIFRA